jgi:hypothetical protein
LHDLPTVRAWLHLSSSSPLQPTVTTGPALGLLPSALVAFLAGCTLSTRGLPTVAPGAGDGAAADDTAGDDDGPAADLAGADRPSDRPLDAPADRAPDLTAALPVGAACTPAGPRCASGFCVDGFCCENACPGVCQACAASKTGAANGACRPVPDGMDPDTECPAEAMSSCRRKGGCNGSGACAFYAKGTGCAAASCTAGVLTAAAQCDGLGACVTGAPMPCPGNFACASAQTCKTTCTGDADCGPNLGCDVAAAVCSIAKKGQGQACNADGECGTGICADGVCCDRVCTGRCRACLKSLTGLDNGTCANIMAGVKATRPTDCPVQTATCGNDGVCNGAGGCQQIVDGTPCGTYCCGGQGSGGNFCRLLCAGGGCTNQSQTMVGSCDDNSPCSRDRCQDMGTTHQCVHDGACTGTTPCCCTGAGIGNSFCADQTGCTVGLGGVCAP